jgi:two-component system, NtrC family, response regulator
MSEAKQKILLVEDDLGLQKQLKWSLDDYEIVVAADRDNAITQLRRHEPPVVLLDLGLPPDPDGATEGLATLQQILSLAPLTKIIVVTGNLDRSNAVKAISLGAYDFFQKPFEPDILKLMIERALHVQALEAENRKLSASQSHSALQGLLTCSEPMLKICRTVEKVAPANATVLLLGESGTGKEVLARGVHELSPRANKRFVAINCAAIPDTLLESELFGYEKGAFTGAAKQTIGKIEYASEGTLFLDEIGDLPMPLQAKLLRFLQERVIERLGGRGEIPVDVRVVCATHRDLAGMIREGSFREDLYYRLSEITIKIPPLRERPATPCCWRRPSSNATPANSAAASRASPPMRSPRWKCTPGPATCAKWKTSSSAPPSCPTAPCSAPKTSACKWRTPSRNPSTCARCAKKPTASPSAARWRKPAATSPRPPNCSASAGRRCTI